MKDETLLINITKNFQKLFSPTFSFSSTIHLTDFRAELQASKNVIRHASGFIISAVSQNKKRCAFFDLCGTFVSIT